MILKKTHSGFLGVSLDEDNVSSPSESNLDVVGGEEVEDYDANDAEFGTRLLLSELFKSDNIKNNDEPPQLIPGPSDTIPPPLSSRMQQETTRASERV